MADQDLREFERRKREHIEQSLDPRNQAMGMAGLERVRLTHEALPDFNLNQVSLRCLSLGAERKTPFLVSSMTAGHTGATELNELWLRCCKARGWALAVGSQRRQIEDNSASSHLEWKGFANSGVEIIGNLGLAEVIRTPVAEIARLVDSLGASAFFVHLNGLQECIQPEGNPDFWGGWKALENLVKQLSVPVLVKETGCGISASTAQHLAQIGIAAVDVAGLGGTHWGRIEGGRSPSESWNARAAATFANWGLSTVESLRDLREVSLLDCETWASGGLRTGLDAAKVLALGAKRVGFAQPALQAALLGDEKLLSWMEAIERELAVALFCTGSKTVESLREDGKWKIV